MVLTCSAYGCKNRYKKGGIQFHRFPKDSTMRKKWTAAVRRVDFIPSKWSCICGDHFTDNDYHPSIVSEKKTLNPDAVPSIFNFPSHFKKKLKKNTLTDVTENNVMPILPEKYTYTDLSFDNNKLEFYCNNLYTPEEIKGWVKKFGYENGVQWRTLRTGPDDVGPMTFYKGGFKCEHGKPQKSCLSKPTLKGPACPADIMVHILRTSTYDPIKTHIVINNNHIHETGMAKYRNVKQNTKESLQNLYREGFLPTSALFTLQLDILIEHSQDFTRIFEEESQVPDELYCCNLYTKYKEKCPDDIPFEDVHCKLEKWCKETNGHATYSLEDNNFIFTILTPLMQKVHTEIPQSGEVVYIESNDNRVGKKNETIYFIYTHTNIGPLPLGYIITSSRAPALFQKGLTQLCSLDEETKYFFESGSLEGPKNVIVDNSLDKNVVWKVWPNCNVLFSTTHVLSSVWQWLSDKKENVRENDKKVLFFNFKKIMTAETREDILHYYNNLLTVNTLKQYPGFYNYINSVWWPIRDSWCLYYRKDLKLVEKECWKYNEYAFRILKDTFLNYFKVYDTNELIYLTISRLDNYYSKRINDILVHKVNFSKLPTFRPIFEEISPLMIEHVGGNNFLISNVDKEDFIGDLELNMCTCDIGILGALCEHQSAVLLSKKNVEIKKINRITYQALFDVMTEMTPLVNTTDDEMVETCDTSENENECEDSLIVDISEDLTTEKIEESGETCNENDIEVHQQMSQIFEDILKRVQNGSTPEMIDACKKFCQNYESCEDDESLQAALCMFGKNQQLVKEGSNKGRKRKFNNVDKEESSKNPEKVIRIRSKEEQIILIVE